MTKWLYRASLVGIWIISGMYLAASLQMSNHQGIQLTRMFEMNEESVNVNFFTWFYTGSLLLTAVVGYLGLRVKNLHGAIQLVAGSCLGLTLMPLIYSGIYSFKPSYYEYYVGEVLTCVLLSVLAVTSNARAPLPTHSPT